jgi:hypothetical protein
VRPQSRPGREQRWLAAAGLERVEGAVVCGAAGVAERGVEVRHHAHEPAAAVLCAAVGSQRVDLWRRAVLVAFQERVALGVDRRLGLDAEAAAGAGGALAGDDRLQPGERVDAELGHYFAYRSMSSTRSASRRYAPSFT